MGVDQAVYKGEGGRRCRLALRRLTGVRAARGLPMVSIEQEEGLGL
jgi:hypothetical protein